MWVAIDFRWRIWDVVLKRSRTTAIDNEIRNLGYLFIIKHRRLNAGDDFDSLYLKMSTVLNLLRN